MLTIRYSKKLLAALWLLLLTCACALQASAGVYFVHADAQDTPLALTNSAKTVVWRSDHQPYGEAIVDEDVDRDNRAVEMPIRYPGQYFDKESGLHYNYYRYYNPRTGRYLESDPIGLAGGINTYAYAEGNPVSYTDPTGLVVFLAIPAGMLVDWGVGAAVGFGVRAYGAYLLRAQLANNLIAGGAVAAAGFPMNPIALEVQVASAALPAARQAASRVCEAANMATHMRYKDELRAAMGKPTVADSELADFIDKLYRPNAKIGSGSTAAAVREELVTGQPVGNAFHSTKANGAIKFLERWLTKNPAGRPGDRAAAENLIIDMSNALEGR